MDRAERVGPYLLFRPVARHPLDCRAYVADGAIGVEDRDDIRAVLYQSAEALLALYDYFLELLAFAYVLDLGDEVQRLAFFVVHERDAQERPHNVALLVEVALLHLVGAYLSDKHPAHLVEIRIEALGVGYLLEGLAKQLHFSVAEHVAQGSVRPKEAPVCPHQRHPDVCVLEGPPEPLLG